MERSGKRRMGERDLKQRPIRTEEGDLYVSFWNSGSDYFITTEEKLKDASLRHSDVGRGGIGMRMG